MSHPIRLECHYVRVAPGRKCVWCGSPANSKEHVFPQWLRSFAGPSAFIAEHGDYQSAMPGLVARLDRDDQWVEYEATRSPQVPNLHMVQVKAVCKSCNENWMSQLERAVKPIVSRLVDGGGIDLSAKDVETLASWAHKTFMMYDQWHDRADRRYRDQEYKAFYVDRRPPANVRLYMVYSPPATFGMHSDSRCVIPPGEEGQSYMKEHFPNCGSSWLAVDGLLIVEHWFSPEYPSQDRVRRFGKSVRISSHQTMQKLGAHEIWPAPHELRGWPRRELSTKQMRAAMLSLFDALRTRRVVATRIPPPA